MTTATTRPGRGRRAQYMSVVAVSLAALGVQACGCIQIGRDEPTVTDDNPTYQVIRHAPGPQWASGKAFREQPGVDEHVRYLEWLREQGYLLMGGPYLDESGGMVVLKVPTVEDARRLADDDPAVRSGLLTVTVHPWLVPLSRMEPRAVASE